MENSSVLGMLGGVRGEQRARTHTQYCVLWFETSYFEDQLQAFDAVRQVAHALHIACLVAMCIF